MITHERPLTSKHAHTITSLHKNPAPCTCFDQICFNEGWGVVRREPVEFFIQACVQSGYEQTGKLTDKSERLLSLEDTARTTPDRHSHSLILASFNFAWLLTDKNLFPTISSLHLKAILSVYTHIHILIPFESAKTKETQIVGISPISVRGGWIPNTSLTFRSKGQIKKNIRYRK